MLSQTTEYALRAVVYLARDPDRARTSQEIATGTHVPAGYLYKVLQALGKVGLVQSQRGLHGGFTLSRSPEHLTILQVVKAVDEVPRIHECPVGLHKDRLCPLHRRLDEAMGALEKQLDQATISMLLEEPGGCRPLCDDCNTDGKCKHGELQKKPDLPVA